ncbi:MAG: LlaJI family restriction endonuclease [Lutibacter sp.]|nr:LlaJI family restriction endonuclease [Lutibacter sp.]
MHLLIEGYRYDNKLLSTLLPDKYITDIGNGRASTNFVGYFNSSQKSGMVLILPKIFLTGEFVFNSVPVVELASENSFSILKKYDKSKTEADFIYTFSLTLFLCLKEFIQRNPETIIINKEKLRSITSNLSYFENTELDLVVSLLQFYKNNKSLITFKVKTKQSELGRRISWNKTVNKTLPVFTENDSVVYFNPIQKIKHINYEDELLRIFYSVLFKFKTEYGFKLIIDENYNIITATNFLAFELKALKVLKSLKHKYFSDKFKHLYKLLYLYFQKKSESNSKAGLEEFILSSNFNIVFENMIDKLLSDTKNIEKLKYQADGKIVDHIFEFNSLFNPDKIFYVGDSKYYKETTQYGVNSIYKQHTYAKNVIQYNINLFNTGILSHNLRYRDSKTEGYNITPNFFIQAFIDNNNLTDTAAKFQNDTAEKVKINFQFKNRLFDRDTLIIHNFKINFLFVVRSYLTKDVTLLSSFKAHSINFIRENILNHFQNYYSFFILSSIIPIDSFIEKHFKILNGKIYSSSEFDSSPNSIILAINNQQEFLDDNEKLINIIQADCILQKIDITVPTNQS